jgi:uncharacterized protein (TIGR02246 family)
MANNNQAARDIETVFQTMADLWNRHDTRAYTSLWKEDADFVNVLGMHRGSRKEMQAELDYLHAGRFKDTQIRLEHHKIRFLSPDCAVAHLWWEMSGDPGMPGYPVEDGRRRGIFTHVLERTPDGWRFVASQNTDVLPISDPLRAAEPMLTGSAK